MTIIARYEAPKQRITRQYCTILVENQESDNEDRFSVHRAYVEGDMDYGEYNLTAEQAWEEFHKRIRNESGYGPGTWEHLS